MTAGSIVSEGGSTTKQDRIEVHLLGLVVLVAALGLVVVVLESGLSGEPIPSYLSSPEFDRAEYGRLFEQPGVLCSANDVTSLIGGVECVAYDDHGGFAYPVVMTLLASLGALLVHRWGNPIGWFLILGPLVDVTGAAAGAYALRGAVIDPGSLPASRFLAAIGSVAWVFLLVLIVPRFLMTVPTGSLPSNGWRWAVRFTYAVAAALGLIALFHPMLIGSIPNPIALPWSVETADSVSGFAILGMMACWAIGGLALLLRVLSGLRRRLIA